MFVFYKKNERIKLLPLYKKIIIKWGKIDLPFNLFYCH
jgi:hypothetical protein